MNAHEPREERLKNTPGGPLPGTIPHAIPGDDMGTDSQATRRDLDQFEPGAVVVTSDGEPVGAVKESDGQFLLIDAPMKDDFWINKDLAMGGDSTPERLVLTVTAEQLPDYELDKPGLQDGLISSAEMQAQREHMEDELAAQRARRNS